MAGPYATLMEMLRSSPPIADNNISILFGEENISSQDQALPYVTVVPNSGPWDSPAYIFDQDPENELSWSTTESIDLYLWNAAPDSPETVPEDNADAVLALRQWVLQAFQFQRAPGGLFYKPTQGRWMQMKGAQVRFGRCYVLTVVVEIPAMTDPPVEATVEEITLNPSFSA